MKAPGWLLPALALVLGLALGGWLAWSWQANVYGKALAEQAEAYSTDREQAATAGGDQLAGRAAGRPSHAGGSPASE